MYGGWGSSILEQSLRLRSRRAMFYIKVHVCESFLLVPPSDLGSIPIFCQAPFVNLSCLMEHFLNSLDLFNASTWSRAHRMSLETGRQNLNGPSVHHIQAGQSDVLLLDRTWEFEASYWGDTNPPHHHPVATCYVLWWLARWMSYILESKFELPYKVGPPRFSQTKLLAVSENRSTRCSRMHFEDGHFSSRDSTFSVTKDPSRDRAAAGHMQDRAKGDLSWNRQRAEWCFTVNWWHTDYT